MVSALPESLEGILLGACFEVAEPIVAPGVSASIYGPPTMSNRRSGADRGRPKILVPNFRSIDTAALREDSISPLHQFNSSR